MFSLCTLFPGAGGVPTFPGRGGTTIWLMGSSPFLGPGRGVPTFPGGGILPCQAGGVTTFQGPGRGYYLARQGVTTFPGEYYLHVGGTTNPGGVLPPGGYYLPWGTTSRWEVPPSRGVLPSQVRGYYLQGGTPFPGSRIPPTRTA